MILRIFCVFCHILVLIQLGSTSTTSTTGKPSRSEDGNKKDFRRILQGVEAEDTRPYIVYLRPTKGSEVSVKNWLCGGVIIHEHYILTSAACIEDAKQFEVVSGTHRWVSMEDESNECVQNGAIRATWKCVPKTYVYDGKESDNINWMKDDIAIVRLEDDINFKKRVKGCDFIPSMIGYNNVSEDFEKPGVLCSLAGWGTVGAFADVIGLLREKPENSPELLETDTKIISKKNCKKRWPERYHQIIETFMICTKTTSDTVGCDEEDLKCQQLIEDNEEEEVRRMIGKEPEVHFASHKTEEGRRNTGGFCENDHGGPLIAGVGMNALVVGVISACQTRPDTKRCYGPFLYTSVWTHRRMIDCAINKDVGTRRRAFSTECRNLIRTATSTIKETFFEWTKPSGRQQVDKIRPLIEQRSKKIEHTKQH